MSDDEEIHLHVTYVTHMDMDEAFRACMRIAIAAGLESVPIGVVTTPGTQNPKYGYSKDDLAAKLLLGRYQLLVVTYRLTLRLPTPLTARQGPRKALRCIADQIRCALALALVNRSYRGHVSIAALP